MPSATSPRTMALERDHATDRANDLDAPHLPDHARILRLLEANDGRLWQGEVVAELDVSKATVSRRLSELEDASYVERMLFRGRNLVWLPDATPDVIETST